MVLLWGRGNVGFVIGYDTFRFGTESIVVLVGVEVALDGDLLAIVRELNALMIGRGDNLHGMDPWSP